MPITVRPLTSSIGAEIDGVDLSRSLAGETVAEIRQALLDHLVIFFREQTLTPSQQLEFATQFGEPIEYPFVEPLPDTPFIVPIVKLEHETLNFGGSWHSDTVYLETPPLGTVLYARQVPPVGGDTLFANQYLAFDSLSAGMKELLNGLTGIHRSDKLDATRKVIQNALGEPDENTRMSQHPVVRTHPETGRKALYLNVSHTTSFKGMTETESAPILAYLFQQQIRPEFCCRFRWQAGSLAFWDNRCSLHYPVNDYHGHRREMHRITLAGERPR